MGFGKTLTVSTAINKIVNKEYLLPAIQREFVWKETQIERLFDSLMRDYPVGSFLFWDVNEENSSKYEYYEFIKHYHERDFKHNPRYELERERNLVAVLDGQQRLTSFYIGIKGSYASKVPRKRWDNDKAFPRKYLYLNLLNKADGEDFEYEFKFLSKKRAEQKDDNNFWFKVSDILQLKSDRISEFIIDNFHNAVSREKARLASKILSKLSHVINEKEIIHPFIETDDELDKVLNIFIRVNSAGTELSYSDLLLSIATAQWDTINAREEITHFVDDINKIGSGFNFNKDFILKSCLVLSDIKDIAFKVDNFNSANMRKIEGQWNEIKHSIKLAVNLISYYGFNRDYLPSNNAIIPIAYFLHQKVHDSNFIDSPRFENDRRKIRKWLIHSLLKKVFSGQPDTPLRNLRTVLSSNVDSGFPLTAIVEEFRGKDKSIIFDDDEIENLLGYKYGQRYTFSTLALLYPTLDFRNYFHIDHIHPTSEFHKNKLQKLGLSNDEIDDFKEKLNSLPNLQLLEGRVNQSKNNTPFERWLNRSFSNDLDKRDFMRKHYIPGTDLSIRNFQEFFEKREETLFNAFKEMVSFDQL